MVDSTHFSARGEEGVGEKKRRGSAKQVEFKVFIIDSGYFIQNQCKKLCKIKVG